jgi:hypothetical protein
MELRSTERVLNSKVAVFSLLFSLEVDAVGEYLTIVLIGCLCRRLSIVGTQGSVVLQGQVWKMTQLVSIERTYSSARSSHHTALGIGLGQVDVSS